MPVQGSLNHLRDARKALAILWTESEPRGAKVFDEGEALEDFKRLRDNWKLVDGTLPSSSRATWPRTRMY